MDTLLEKVKANLILSHTEDDELLQMYITAAVRYAESFVRRCYLTIVERTALKSSL